MTISCSRHLCVFLTAPLGLAIWAEAPGATRYVSDQSFNLPVLTRPLTAPISTCPLSDGGALIAGAFGSSGGQPVGLLARFDAQGVLVNGEFASQRSPSSLASMPVMLQMRDGRVLVAMPRNPSETYDAPIHVYRVDLSGVVDPGYDLVLSPADGDCASVAGLWLAGDDRVIVAGNFAKVGAHLTCDVARLDATGEIDETFTSQTEFGGPFGVAPDGSVLGMSMPDTSDPLKTKPARLVHLGSSGESAESWEMPEGSSARVSAVAALSDSSYLVSCNTQPDIFWATVNLTLVPVLPSFDPGTGGFTLFRLRSGDPAWTVFYTSPPGTENGGTVFPAVGAVDQMHATANGVVVLVGRDFPLAFDVNATGIMAITKDGEPDSAFRSPDLGGKRIIDLRPANGGWLVTLQTLPSRPTFAVNVRKLNGVFAPEPGFAPDLRQNSMPESAIALPDGSVVAQGRFLTPGGALRRFVRVHPDGTEDFDNVPRGDDVASAFLMTVGGDRYVYVGGSSNNVVIAGPIETAGTVASEEGGALLAPNEIQRYSLDGILDTAFGKRVIESTQVTRICVDHLGRILVGCLGSRPIQRLLPNGELDPSFQYTLPAPDYASATALTELADHSGYLVGVDGSVVVIDRSGGARDMPNSNGVPFKYELYGLQSAVSIPGSTYVAGHFDSVLGVGSSQIARLGANLLPDSSWISDLGNDSIVTGVQVLPDMRLLLSGSFQLSNQMSGECTILGSDGLVDQNESLPALGVTVATTDGAVYSFSPDGKVQRFVAVLRPALAIVSAAPSYREGDTLLLRASASVEATSFTWLRDGAVLPGQAGCTLEIQHATADDGGIYTLRITTAQGVVTASVRVSVSRLDSQIVAASARSMAGAGENVQVTGWTVRGTTDLPVLARSLRSALADFGLERPAAGGDFTIAVDGVTTWYALWPRPWYRGPFRRVEDIVLKLGLYGVPDFSDNPQSLLTLTPGSSYALLFAPDREHEGVALSEIYMPSNEDGNWPQRLAAFSCRANVGAGERVLIAGFVIAGTEELPLLIRGSGPALKPYGISAAVGHPILELRYGQHLLDSNSGWDNQPEADEITAAENRVGVSPFEAGSQDAALLVTLPPGAYTAMVRNGDGTPAVGMIELFDARR